MHGDGADGWDETGPLADEESLLVSQDLDDLDDFERIFAADGVKGVSLWCHECEEEHFYPWDLLRGSLQLLLETGELPMHEPAFAPDPDDYVPWEYARGYVDALRDAGVDERVEVTSCPRCHMPLEGDMTAANYCPRCATPLVQQRIRIVLGDLGLDPDSITQVLRQVGFPS